MSRGARRSHTRAALGRLFLGPGGLLAFVLLECRAGIRRFAQLHSKIFAHLPMRVTATAPSSKSNPPVLDVVLDLKNREVLAFFFVPKRRAGLVNRALFLETTAWQDYGAELRVEKKIQE